MPPAPEVRVPPSALRKDFRAVFDELYARGDLVWIRSGQRRFLLVNSPRYVREVMVERAEELVKPVSQRIETGPPSPEEVPDQDLLRAFRQALARGMGPERTPEVLAATAKAAAIEAAEWDLGARVRLMPAVRRMVIRLICGSAFASRLTDAEIVQLERVMSSFDRRERVVTRASRLAERLSGQALGHRVALARLFVLAQRVLENADLSTPSEASAVAVDLPRLDPGANARAQAALAGELLIGAVGPLTQMAGWTLWRFSTEPEDAARVRAEWDDVLEPDEPVSVDTLGRLRHTTAFVREVTRLHPTNVRITRSAIVDTRVGSEAVPAQTRVLLNVNGFQRDPRFFDEPERFLPGRRPKDKFAYVSFGVGERRCIGEGIAVTALVALLPALTRTRELSFGRIRTTSRGRKQLTDDTEVTVGAAPEARRLSRASGS